jgi:hypothetical protein
MSTTNPMPQMDPPQPAQSSSEQLKFLWIIVGVVVCLTVVYLTHWTYLRIRYRRTPRQQPQNLPTTDFERNWGDAVPLQPLQPAALRRRASDEILPAPLYDRHVNDQGLPPGVKLERRGSYHYVARGDNPPPYTILEEPRSFRR